nr:PR domain zinc finger protein 15-like [Dermacentor andersoni]
MLEVVALDAAYDSVMSSQGKSVYTCKLCNKAFQNYSNLKRHVKLHDPVQEYFPCTLCQRKYGRKDTLKGHMKQAHGVLTHNLDESGTTFDLERKTPRCRLCQRTFYNSSSLRRHMQRHLANNRQRFPCGVCSKEFTRKDYVREHRMNVHGMPT